MLVVVVVSLEQVIFQSGHTVFHKVGDYHTFLQKDCIFLVPGCPSCDWVRTLKMSGTIVRSPLATHCVFNWKVLSLTICMDWVVCPLVDLSILLSFSVVLHLVLDLEVCLAGSSGLMAACISSKICWMKSHLPCRSKTLPCQRLVAQVLKGFSNVVSFLGETLCSTCTGQTNLTTWRFSWVSFLFLRLTEEWSGPDDLFWD